MKHAREIKVAVLATVCVFLVYFGFYFLRGVNIFSPVDSYVGKFANVGGLTEQAPVMVRGYKVGQVDEITYDFSQSEAFTVHMSIDNHIVLPAGTRMVLASNGLLGGKMIELDIPSSYVQAAYHSGDTLPTMVALGLVESLEAGVLVQLDSAMAQANELLLSLNGQLSDQNIRSTLANVHRITENLNVTSQDLKYLTHAQLPGMVAKADTAMSDLREVLSEVQQADLNHTLSVLDTTVTQLQQVLTSKEGTLGMLLYDDDLYAHVDSAVVSLQALVSDLKANPKRYVNIQVFGKKKD